MADQFSDAPYAYPQGSFYADLNTRIVALEAALGTGAGIVPDGAVTTFKLANDAVTAAKLANLSVDTAAIIDANVTLAKLAANSVDASKIIDGTITLAELNAAVYASQAEAEAGTENTKFLTSLRTKQAIAKLGPKLQAVAWAQGTLSGTVVTVTENVGFGTITASGTSMTFPFATPQADLLYYPQLQATFSTNLTSTFCILNGSKLVGSFATVSGRASAFPAILPDAFNVIVFRQVIP